MRFLSIILILLFCSCGALKRTKRVDRVKQSVELDFKSIAVSEDKSKMEDKSIKEEKVSEKRSNEVTEEKHTFFDDNGNVMYVWERKTSYNDESLDRSVNDSSDVSSENEGKSKVDLEGEFKSKVDSLKKETDTVQPENSVFKFIGIGILIVFAAIALVVFIRFRK